MPSEKWCDFVVNYKTASENLGKIERKTLSNPSGTCWRRDTPTNSCYTTLSSSTNRPETGRVISRGGIRTSLTRYRGSYESALMLDLPEKCSVAYLPKSRTQIITNYLTAVGSVYNPRWCGGSWMKPMTSTIASGCATARPALQQWKIVGDDSLTLLRIQISVMDWLARMLSR